MERRTLGNTDLSVSRIALGTMTFGAQVDETAARAMIDACLDRGVNFIDTANVYTGGESERIVGRALRGRRDRVVLASKVGIKTGDGPDEAGLSRVAILQGVEASLRRLGTDHLDLFYLHQPDPATSLEETLGTVDELVRAGKVRHLGVSNYAAWQVGRMVGIAEQNGWSPVRVTQPMFNLVARGIEPEFLPMCREFGLGVVAYNPLAGGLLTGKHQIGTPETGTRFDRMPVYRDRYWNRENLDAVRALTAAAATANRSMVGLALGWLLHHSPVDCVILGASGVGQLQENLAAADLGPLSAEAIAACDLAWKSVRGVSPQYHR